MAYLLEEDPWLHRYSRPVLMGLSIAGCLLTAYLTFTKLTAQVTAFCTEGAGCDLVLSSRWSVLLGIPTAAWGFLGFLAVLVLASAPDSLPLVKKWRWPALFGLVSAMMTFELYMVYLMVGVLKQLCFYCLTSVGLVIGITAVTLLGYRWLDWARLAFGYVIIGLLTWVATVGIYANQLPPPSSLALNLANHLQKNNIAMYGAYWCPHCQDQKDIFGSAFKKVPYVECSPNGPQQPTAPACVEKQVRSYPTWIIDGKHYTGAQSLERLAELTGYKPELD